MKRPPLRCCAKLQPKDSSLFSMVRLQYCDKIAKVTRDGAHYCGIHDPVKRQASLEAQQVASKQRRLQELKSSAIRYFEQENDTNKLSAMLGIIKARIKTLQESSHDEGRGDSKN